MFQAAKLQSENESILRDLLHGMLPSMRLYVHGQSLTLDILSYLLQIICPQMKSVNITLLNKTEKENLQHVVNVMIEYNLTYIQERDEKGTYSYRLDPNIDRLTHFGEENTQLNGQLSYSAKQLLAREVELEKLRRFQGAGAGQSSASVPAAKPVPVVKTPARVENDDEISSTPVRSQNHLMKLQPKKLDDITVKKVVSNSMIKYFLIPTHTIIGSLIPYIGT